jgi:hypothetical protein
MRHSVTAPRVLGPICSLATCSSDLENAFGHTSWHVVKVTSQPMPAARASAGVVESVVTDVKARLIAA